MNKFLVGILLLLFSSTVFSQQTVGLFQNDSGSSPGYTLFSPVLGTDVYLIDNCGEYVNKWDLDSRPGLMAYLTNDGSLLRTERIGSNFNSGGNGGRVRKYDWEGNQTWTFDITGDNFHSHHDVAILPNGNILAIVWESFTKEDVIEMGRNPMLTDSNLWLEKIVELKPIGTDQAEEVWSWHLVDHLIQDFDSTKTNFGIVSQHPEKMDLNFNGGGNFPLGSNRDWVHFNGIDYNEELDQIILSSRHFSEIWIIDHSTTTEEAATDMGGNSEKGGRLLYRWGNPRVYKRGVPEDQKFYLQHDATWIKIGDNQNWGFSVYNNGTGRPGQDYSQVDLVKLPILPDNNYELLDTFAYGPSTPTITIDQVDGETFFNTNISGSSLLHNGNALICVGGSGNFFEVDTSTLEPVWKYIVPLSTDTPVMQGLSTNANSVFKIRRYALDFPGFLGKDLTPIGPIETSPLPSSCVTSTKNAQQKLASLEVWPNPTTGFVHLENNFEERKTAYLYNVWGELVLTQVISHQKELDLSNLIPGLYYLKISGYITVRIVVQQP